MTERKWTPRHTMSAFSDKTHYSCYIEGYNSALRDSNAAGLYEALEAAMDELSGNGYRDDDGPMPVILAALAKARGEL